MRIAEWIVDAGVRMQNIAELRSDDTDEIYFLVGRALMRLLNERQSFDARASHDELKAALSWAERYCASPAHSSPSLGQSVSAPPLSPPSERGSENA